jgi:hypothetical protein
VLTADLSDTLLEAVVGAAQAASGLLLGPLRLVVLQQEGCLLSRCAGVQAQAAVQKHEGQRMLPRSGIAACHVTAALLHVPGVLALQD